MGCFGEDPPDPAKGYVAGINTDLQSLPARRMIEALAMLGERGTVDIPGRGPTEFDFTGLGAADYQRQYSDQLVGELLQIQREYGPQYVEQRLKELEAADPQGAAMRRQLWGAIQESAGTLTDRSDAEQLQGMVLDRLNRGAELDPEVEKDISQRVLGSQVARGNYLGNAAANQEAEVLAQAGEQQRAQAQQEAMAFLTGGLSPQDAAYREQQQDLANIGAFLSGETPTAQFGQLSGAQAGVVPFQGGGPLPGTNPNAGWQGVQNQQNAWNINQQAAAGQVNPWVAGLSGAFQGVNTWLSLGGAGGGGVTTQQAINNVRAAY